MKAQMPMKMSMKILTVAVVPSIQPFAYLTPSAALLARISDSAIAPLATAAPSVFTASPIHAPATMGSCARKAFAANGRSEEHTSELQSHSDLVCRLLLEKKKK